MEYPLLDRMSYKRFCGLANATNIPDRTTVWPRRFEARAERHRRRRRLFTEEIEPDSVASIGMRRDSLKSVGYSRHPFVNHLTAYNGRNMNWSVAILSTGLEERNLGDILQGLGYRMTNGPEGLVFSSDEMACCTAAADVFELAKKVRSVFRGPANIDDEFQLGNVVEYSCTPPKQHAFLEGGSCVCHAICYSASITIGPPEGLNEEELAVWNREQKERNYQAQLQRQLERAVPAFHNENASLVLEFLNLKEQTGETLFKVFELMVGDADNVRVKKRFITNFGVSDEQFRRFSDAVHNRTVSGNWARHATMRQPKSGQPMSKTEAETFVRRLADGWLKTLM